MPRPLDLLSLAAGAVFIVLGVGLLAKVALSVLWPLALIAIGAAAVTSVVKRNEAG